MMDQLFFENDTDRLASIVGMYNIYPGMAHSTQNKIMAYFKNMMDGWLASKDATGKYRTAAGFAKTFIGDKPMMFAGYQGKPATPSYGEGQRLPPEDLDIELDEGW